MPVPLSWDTGFPLLGLEPKCQLFWGVEPPGLGLELHDWLSWTSGLDWKYTPGSLEGLSGLLTLKILGLASLRNGMSKFLITPSLSVCLSLSPFILWVLLPWRALIQPLLT